MCRCLLGVRAGLNRVSKHFPQAPNLHIQTRPKIFFHSLLSTGLSVFKCPYSDQTVGLGLGGCCPGPGEGRT